MQSWIICNASHEILQNVPLENVWFENFQRVILLQLRLNDLQKLMLSPLQFSDKMFLLWSIMTKIKRNAEPCNNFLIRCSYCDLYWIYVEVYTMYFRVIYQYNFWHWNLIWMTGIDVRAHDIRFVEDNWESPVISCSLYFYVDWLEPYEIEFSFVHFLK